MKITPIILFAAVAAVLIGLASPASAQGNEEQRKQEARSLSAQGDAKYRVGDFKDAIDLYKKAYGVFQAPPILYNIAQAYRQDGNCKRAVFFYRQFLSEMPAAPNADEVRVLIKEEEGKCRGGTGTTGTGTTGTGTTGTGTGTTGTGTGTGQTGTGQTGAGTGTTTGAQTGVQTGTQTGTETTGSGGEVSAGTGAGGGSVSSSVDGDSGGTLVASAQLGISIIGMGDLETPVPGTLAIGAGYPLTVGPLDLEVGAMVTLTGLPWEAPNGETGSALLTGLLANVGATYPLPANLTLRGDVGLGVLVFSGIDDVAAPLFFEDGMVADGALGMFNVRLGVGVEYPIMPGLVASFEPAVAISPTQEGFRDDIGTMTRLQVMLGALYRM